MTACIVALPTEDDRVRKYSSEVPHMTMLFLGELTEIDDIYNIGEFLEHVASVAYPFGMTVKRRGTLGPDNADVLFFEENKTISELRDFLLRNDAIKKAYDSVHQYPQWTPHLTMGYPETPAKPLDDDSLYYVQYDRLALWLGDSEGIEFPMRDHGSDLLADVSMTDKSLDALQHYGVLGMKWGVRKSAPALPVPVSLATKPGQKVRATGGQNQPASADAKKAARLKQRAKASTTDSLSDKQLRELVNRMNLEQQYSNLSTQAAARDMSPAAKFIKDIFSDAQGVGRQHAKSVVNYQLQQALVSRGVIPEPKKKGK